jgi:predicted small lipoprotein YifL
VLTAGRLWRKGHSVRLHLAGCGLELPDANHTRDRTATREEEMSMKRLMLLMMVMTLAASLAGCNSCRRGFGLFNRGDRCDDCPPLDCGPGVPRATMMVPGTTVMPSGPIEIAPAS